MKEVATLKDLMIHQLQSLYEAENVWSDTLKQNEAVITSKELKKSLEKGSKVALEHATKLKKILTDLGTTTLAKKNVVANDLAREIREIQEASADPEVLDAGFIVNHQCMNHYMIAKYGTVSSYARLLQEEDIAVTLHKIMEEEKLEDLDLTKLAETKINVKAKTAVIH